MNENQIPDDLPEHLDALGDELRRPPRPDARIESGLGAGPPIAAAPSAADVLPLPITDDAPKRRTAWIAVAAALALIAGVGLAAFAIADDDPVLPATAAEGDDDPMAEADDGATGEGDTTEDAVDASEPEADDPEPEADAPEPEADDPHEWLECMTEQLGSIFEDGFSAGVDEFAPVDQCGEPPLLGGMFFDGFPDIDELPDEWSVPGLGDWRSLDELCSSESTDSGLDVACVWPSCPDDAEGDCPFPPECAREGDDGESVLCFDFSHGFDFGLEIDPEGFGFSVPFGGEGGFFFDPEMLPDTFPDLPDDFEFPHDLPELEEWFENSPWADRLEDMFASETSDA